MRQTAYQVQSYNHAVREQKRIFIVQAVFVIYFLFLLQGPLRKWILPGLSGPLIFLLDLPLICLYFYCFTNQFLMRGGIALQWLRFAVFSSFFGVVQYSINGYDIIGWILGVRTYWLCMPLAFVVAVTFQHEDVMRFLKLNLWVALPYSLLVITQYSAGPNAFINRGVGADETAAVTLDHAMGIIRPFGLFSYTYPNVVFTAAIVAIYLAVFLSRAKDRPIMPILIAMAMAVSTIAILTGSRSIYFFLAATFAITVIFQLSNNQQNSNTMQIIFIVGLVALAGWLFVNYFPDMLAAMEVRVETANRAEGSLWNRIDYSFFSFWDALGTAPVWGHGIGSGASGVSRFLGLPPLLHGEADTQRNVNELGIALGTIFLFLRWFTSWYVLNRAIKLSRVGLPSVLPLSGFVAFSIATIQITNSPIIAFLPWLLLGMILAYENIYYNPSGAVNSSVNTSNQSIRE
jgi:hypothetical protein